MALLGARELLSGVGRKKGARLLDLAMQITVESCADVRLSFVGSETL